MTKYDHKFIDNQFFLQMKLFNSKDDAKRTKRKRNARNNPPIALPLPLTRYDVLQRRTDTG